MEGKMAVPALHYALNQPHVLGVRPPPLPVLRVDTDGPGLPAPVPASETCCRTASTDGDRTWSPWQ